VQRLVAIDAIAAAPRRIRPDDPALAAPTRGGRRHQIYPVSPMRVVMIEHARSGIEGDSFDLSVLEEKPGFLTRLFRALAETSRGRMTFPLSSARPAAANLRRAYREEAKRAGAKAPSYRVWARKTCFARVNKLRHRRRSCALLTCGQFPGTKAGAPAANGAPTKPFGATCPYAG